MKVKLKFSIGDKFIRDTDNKEFTIDLWEVRNSINNDLEIFYCFHAYLDEEIDYHQRIPEADLLTGKVEQTSYNYLRYGERNSTYKCVEAHPTEVELDTTDAHGEQINLGDNIFTSMYYGGLEKDPETNKWINTRHTDCRLTFSSYSQVYEIQFTAEKTFSPSCTVKYTRIGPSYDKDGKPFTDSRKANSNGDSYIKSCFKHPNNEFKDMFVDSFKGRTYEREHLLNGDEYEELWMLDKLGIKDEVLERIRNRQYSKSPVKKKTVKKPVKKKTQKPKDVDWEALAKQLAEKSGVDINELIKGKKNYENKTK